MYAFHCCRITGKTAAVPALRFPVCEGVTRHSEVGGRDTSGQAPRLQRLGMDHTGASSGAAAFLAQGALASILTRERPMEQNELWVIIALIAPFIGAILLLVFEKSGRSC